MRMPLIAGLFLLTLLASASPAAADDFVIGRCEIDACVILCVDLGEPCYNGKPVCVTIALNPPRCLPP